MKLHLGYLGTEKLDSWGVIRSYWGKIGDREEEHFIAL